MTELEIKPKKSMAATAGKQVVGYGSATVVYLLITRFVDRAKVVLSDDEIYALGLALTWLGNRLPWVWAKIRPFFVALYKKALASVGAASILAQVVGAVGFGSWAWVTIWFGLGSASCSGLVRDAHVYEQELRYMEAAAMVLAQQQLTIAAEAAAFDRAKCVRLAENALVAQYRVPYHAKMSRFLAGLGDDPGEPPVVPTSEQWCDAAPGGAP